MILSLRRCLSVLLEVDIPGETWNIASLPLSLGGLGFLGAHRSQMVDNRHPDIPAVVVRSVHDQNVGHLQGGGHWFCRTLMEDLAKGFRPAITFDDDDPTTPKHGWQFVPTRAVHSRLSMWPRLPESSRAMLRSQSGPLTFFLWP